MKQEHRNTQGKMSQAQQGRIVPKISPRSKKVQEAQKRIVQHVEDYTALDYLKALAEHVLLPMAEISSESSEEQAIA